MFKRLLGFVFLCLAPVFAQVPQQGSILISPPLPRVTTVISQATVHQHGTYFYWIIANLQRGQSWPQGPFVVYQAPDILNVSQTITLTWQAVPNALSYDVLKTPNPVLPATGVNCSCALSVGQGTTSFVDNGQASSSYTPQPITNATVSLTVNDANVSQPQLVIGPPGIIATIQGGFDASAATLTSPFRYLASDPATCDSTRKEMYFNTATLVIRACVAPNTWASVAGAGGGGGGSGYSQIQASGTNLNQRSILNMTGAGISCADNIANSRTDCSVAATVTSVSLSVPSEFTVDGGPITSSGTLSISKASQTANTLFAGPASGSSGTPSFRSLVDLDIPSTIVRTSRTLTAGLGLTGGGDLSINRSFAVAPNTTNQQVQVLNNSSLVGTRKAINFLPGTNISYTISDNAIADETDVTVNASGTGYSTVQDNTGTPLTARSILRPITPLNCADNSGLSLTQCSILGLSNTGTANQLVASNGASGWQYFTLGTGLTPSGSNVVIDTSIISSFSTGTSVPSSCTSYGQSFFLITAGAGQKEYYCNGSTYEQINSGGSVSAYSTILDNTGASLIQRNAFKVIAPLNCSDNTTETDCSLAGLTGMGAAGQLIESTGGSWQYVGLGTGLALSGTTLAIDTSSVSSFTIGTSVPGSCVYGQIFYKTNAPAGLRVYHCNGSTYENWMQVAAPPSLTAEGQLGFDSGQHALKYYSGSTGGVGTVPRVLSIQSPGTSDILCANTGDAGCTGHVATTETNFATTYTVPANFFIANKSLRVTIGFALTSTASPANVTFRVKLGTTNIYVTTTNPPGVSLAGDTGTLQMLITGTGAPGASVAVQTISTVPLGAFSFRNTLAQPVNIATNASQTLQASLVYATGTAGNFAYLKSFLVEEVN